MTEIIIMFFTMMCFMKVRIAIFSSHSFFILVGKIIIWQFATIKCLTVTKSMLAVAFCYFRPCVHVHVDQKYICVM